MIKDDDLKCNSQWPRLIHTLAILMIFFKHPVSLTTTLRCFHKTLLGLEVDELLHLLMAFVNISFEKRDHAKRSFDEISSKIFVLICQFWAELNV